MNKLVNFLSDENKGQAEEVNKILMINHPLVEALRNKLDIPYNFYIEGYNDLNQLLLARGFNEVNFDAFDDDGGLSHWTKSANRKIYNLTIADFLFDDERRLRYIKKTDWQDEYVNLIEIDDAVDDDLPF